MVTKTKIKYPVLIYNKYMNQMMTVNYKGFKIYVEQGQYTLATEEDVKRFIHKD